MPGIAKGRRRTGTKEIIEIDLGPFDPFSLGLEKPSRPVRVIVERADAPSATVSRDGMAKILKSGPVKSTVIVIECDTMPANAVTVR